MLLSVILR